MPLLNVHALAGALLVQPPRLTVPIEARSSRCLLRGAAPLAPRIGAHSASRREDVVQAEFKAGEERRA